MTAQRFILTLATKNSMIFKKKLGVENFFKKRDSEKYSNTQICYLIVKAVNSKILKVFFGLLLLKEKNFSNENLPYLRQKKLRKVCKK